MTAIVILAPLKPYFWPLSYIVDIKCLWNKQMYTIFSNAQNMLYLLRCWKWAYSVIEFCVPLEIALLMVYNMTMFVELHFSTYEGVALRDVRQKIGWGDATSFFSVEIFCVSVLGHFCMEKVLRGNSKIVYFWNTL